MMTTVLVQCDFDGTITKEDASFTLLDAFAKGNWRYWLDLYRKDKITVGRFNTESFSLVRADKQTLVNYTLDEVKIRPGFQQFVDYCQQRNYKLVIVSNGLDFYIDAILNSIGVRDVDVYAASTEFQASGLKVQYIGPDGNKLDNAFKEMYARFFLEKGYQVIYVGNGFSDVQSARLAYHVFARDELLDHCQQIKLGCTTFNDFNDVVSGLKNLNV